MHIAQFHIWINGSNAAIRGRAAVVFGPPRWAMSEQRAGDKDENACLKKEI